MSIKKGFITSKPDKKLQREVISRRVSNVFQTLFSLTVSNLLLISHCAIVIAVTFRDSDDSDDEKDPDKKKFENSLSGMLHYSHWDWGARRGWV